MRINHKTRTNYVLLFNFVLFVDLLKKKKKIEFKHDQCHHSVFVGVQANIEGPV